MTAGAGTQHSEVGGSAAAPRSLSVNDRGRCSTQMWSRESTATPITWPSSHLSGSSCGQNGSTWRVAPGTSSCAVAAPSSALCPRPNAMPHAMRDAAIHAWCFLCIGTSLAQEPTVVRAGNLRRARTPGSNPKRRPAGTLAPRVHSST